MPRTWTGRAGEMTDAKYGIDGDLDSRIHKGFTIGKGKKLYWYFIWHPTGNASVYCTELKRRFINADTIITVHFKD